MADAVLAFIAVDFSSSACHLVIGIGGGKVGLRPVIMTPRGFHLIPG